MKAACSYVNFHNQNYTSGHHFRYTDGRRGYPEIALREALMNVLLHRNYSFGADTLIHIYDDRVEMVSVGGLLPGFVPEDLNMGVSLCRNPHLHNVFYHLKLIEADGIGVKK